MGQRVNIQYSVELEDLEEEVTRLFHNTGKKLTDITPCNFDYVSIDLGGIQMIDVLRQKLAGIDLTLRDIQPPPERESPFQQTSDELEVEQLEEQIAKFKETLSAQPNQEPEESN